MPLLHPSDFRNNFFALSIAASSGKKAVEAVGNDFRLPELVQHRQITLFFHGNLFKIDPDL
jgi:hypothetical protein